MHNVCVFKEETVGGEGCHKSFHTNNNKRVCDEDEIIFDSK